MCHVVVIGGGGFIGRHVVEALRTAGHRVETPLGDLCRMEAGALAGAVAVINCAGRFRPTRAQSLEAVHAAGVARLARLCRDAGVRRLLHVSALSPGLETAYQRSKAAGEAALRAASGPGLETCIVRPSLVLGRGGASMALLSGLAALPVGLRLGGGAVRPVAVEDLAVLLCRLVERPSPLPAEVDAVGPRSLPLDGVTEALRAWMGLPAWRWRVTVPAWLLSLAATLRLGPLDPETLSLMRGGSDGHPRLITAVLGPPPRMLGCGPAAPSDRLAARGWSLRLLLRWSLGILWLLTGIVSAGGYPLADSLALVAQTGLPADAGLVAVLGGAALDALLGLALLAGWRPGLVAGAMLASMGVFSLLALGLPAEWWLHPFAPLAKNLPLAAALLTLMVLEQETRHV